MNVRYLCLQATRKGDASYAHVHEIVDGLRRRGVHVTLYETTYSSGAAKPGRFAYLAEFLRVQARVLREIQKGDLLYVRFHFAAAPAVWWAKRRGIKMAVEVNGPYEDLFIAWPMMARVRRLATWMMQLQLKLPDRVIVVTEQLRQWVGERIPGARVEVISNGANTKVFHPNATSDIPVSAPFAMFFGSFAKWQGLDALLAAPQQPNWPTGVSLVLAGEGIEQEAVEQAHRAGTVNYVGRLSQDDVAGLLAKSVGSLIPKNDVGDRKGTGLMPLKLFESMACGVPVVVTDFPGMADVVREDACGIVIPPEDPLALAQAVADLVTDPARAEAMGRNGLTAAVEKHSWDARAQDTYDLLSAL